MRGRKWFILCVIGKPKVDQVEEQQVEGGGGWLDHFLSTIDRINHILGGDK